MDGIPLLQRVRRALSSQVDQIVVCGRAWPGLTRVDDLPIAGLGPLGGLAGALADSLHSWLQNSDDRALYRWARHCGSRAVQIGGLMTNVNRREDLPA